VRRHEGGRIHTIVRELNNENIDVINFTDQPEVFIQRSLAPARLKSVEVDREAKAANVVVMADQVSLAIGKNGQNIRLASKLTGFDINLIKEGGEDEYDIELIDFKPELGEELYLKLINAGLETAKDVINAKLDTLLAVEGLTEEKIREMREMMKRDLEEAEVEEEEEEEEEEELPAAAAGGAETEAQSPEAADGTTAEPADGATAEPADGATAEPADGTTAEPADGTTAEPADGTTAEPADGTTAEPPKPESGGEGEETSKEGTPGA